MYKNATYKEKFADIQEWLTSLIDSIKKDLRNEHLKKDLYFVKKFLSSKNIHKVSSEELAEAYQKAIQEEEKGEELAEFITSRWLLRHSDLYDFFENQLSQIHPDFTKLDEIEFEKAQHLIKNAVDQFGAPKTYLFSVLNSVVFPKESFQKLKIEAQQSQEEQQENVRQSQEELAVGQLGKEHEREMARLIDKYEKKLSGLQKKYITDVENLKKQVAHLQRKLQEKQG